MIILYFALLHSTNKKDQFGITYASVNPEYGHSGDSKYFFFSIYI